MEESHSVKENLECIEINCISHGSSMEYLWAKALGVVSKGESYSWHLLLT